MTDQQSDEAPARHSPLLLPLWIIAVVLVATVAVVGVVLLAQHHKHEKRESYRDGAEVVCSMRETPYSRAFDACVEDEIDAEIARGDAPAFGS